MLVLPTISIRTNGPPKGVLVAGIRKYFKIVEREMKKGGPELLSAVRAETRKALGPKIANTWRRPTLHIGNKDNFNNRLRIRTTVPHIIGAHEFGATIKARRTGWMAIPLHSIEKLRGRGAFRRQQLTPETYSKAFNVELNFIPMKDGRALLLDPRKKGKGPGKGAAVFILYPKRLSIKLKPRLNIRRVERLVARRVQQRIRRAFAKEAGRSAATAKQGLRPVSGAAGVG